MRRNTTKKEHEDTGYIEGLKTERAKAEKALNNLVRAIEQGIFSETTQTRLMELESRKKALTEAIETEEIKQWQRTKSAYSTFLTTTKMPT